ncbi:MAG: L-threonylcarbamoyladenylate synthase [Patescibacteria group bacterium]|nr:L-threonylcarbamoyladenylate synthase [Patescibacteria group bacterium]
MLILKLRKNYKKIIEKVIKSIKTGKVIVCPTDTVYGLLADATNKKAVEKIFKIKKRPFQKPIPIFVKDIKMVKKIAKIDKKQEEFLKKVWPGKVTIVLKPKKELPRGIGKPNKEIGLRIPNYKIINRLLKLCNCPLTGTSANISGRPASTKIKEVLKQFENQKIQPDLVIDAGNLPESKPSIIIDLTKTLPKILRK